MAAKTKGEVLREHQFQPGQSGNPAGRPKGSKNKLAEDFVADVLREWESHGKIAITDMRTKNPGEFVKMVAGMLPKDLNLNINDNLSELSDDELLGQLRALTEGLAPILTAFAEGDKSEGRPALPARVH